MLTVGALLMVSSVSPLIAISYVPSKTAHMTCYMTMLCNSSSLVLRPHPNFWYSFFLSHLNIERAQQKGYNLTTAH